MWNTHTINNRATTNPFKRGMFVYEIVRASCQTASVFSRSQSTFTKSSELSENKMNVSSKGLNDLKVMVVSPLEFGP